MSNIGNEGIESPGETQAPDRTPEPGAVAGDEPGRDEDGAGPAGIEEPDDDAAGIENEGDDAPGGRVRRPDV